MKNIKSNAWLITALEDMQAENIKLLNVKELTSITDVMIICSGNSPRHVKAIVNHLQVTAKEHGMHPLGIEGEDQGEWALIDLADVVVHVMLPQVRELYKLEQLWSAVATSRVNDG